MSTVMLHQQVKVMKERHVAENGVSDMAPFMLVKTDDGRSFLGRPGESMSSALEGGFRMDDLLRMSVQMLRGQHDNVPLRRMMFVSEGYSGHADTMEEVGKINHGDLEHDFAHNPATQVREVLMTNVWEWHDPEVRYELWLTPFHYSDGGVLVWGDDEGPHKRIEGPLPEVGRKVMR